MRGVNGVHHITAIAGPAQENLDFYAGVLGMRLVKRSVNQDDPTTYHLFYADAEGHPDPTYLFPWAQMAAAAGIRSCDGGRARGAAGSLDYWGQRLQRYGTQPGSVQTRFGQQVLAPPIRTVHVALVEAPAGRAFTPWEGSPVPAARGRSAARTAPRSRERDATATKRFLTTVLGFEELAAENGWTRFGFHGSAGVIDVRDAPEARRGAWGVGSVHHLAWRVDDEAHQARMRARVESAGAQATPVIDRFWFKSVYFKEPGGVLFEIATDGPGFAVDEDARTLGETLVLPPWLEPDRASIEQALPPSPPATIQGRQR
jgi:glyoxalase family protein